MGLGGGEVEPAATLEKMWSLPSSPTLLPPGLLTPDPPEETRIKTHRFEVMVTVLGVRLHSIYKSSHTLLFMYLFFAWKSFFFLMCS